MFEKKTCFIESCRWVGLTVIILTNNATHWGEPTGVVDDQEAPAGNQWQHCRVPCFDWPTTDLYQIQRVPSTCIYDIISSSWWIGKKLWKRERERCSRSSRSFRLASVPTPWRMLLERRLQSIDDIFPQARVAKPAVGGALRIFATRRSRSDNNSIEMSLVRTKNNGAETVSSWRVSHSSRLEFIHPHKSFEIARSVMRSGVKRGSGGGSVEDRPPVIKMN